MPVRCQIMCCVSTRLQKLHWDQMVTNSKPHYPLRSLNNGPAGHSTPGSIWGFVETIAEVVPYIDFKLIVKARDTPLKVDECLKVDKQWSFIVIHSFSVNPPLHYPVVFIDFLSQKQIKGRNVIKSLKCSLWNWRMDNNRTGQTESIGAVVEVNINRTLLNNGF